MPYTVYKLVAQSPQELKTGGERYGVSKVTAFHNLERVRSEFWKRGPGALRFEFEFTSSVQPGCWGLVLRIALQKSLEIVGRF
jgi:hypothetical protein